MSHANYFFYWILAMITLWVIGRFSGKAFRTNILSSAIASALFMAGQTSTVWLLLHLYKLAPSFGYFYLILVMALQPLLCFLIFFLCNLLLPGFRAADNGALFRTAFAFYGYTFLGTFLVATLSFFGVFLFFTGAYSSRNGYYDWSTSYYRNYQCHY